MNSKKQKLRELRDQLSEKETSGKMQQEGEESDKTESVDEGSDDEISDEELLHTSKDVPSSRGCGRKRITRK